jgi:hypothetical protein
MPEVTREPLINIRHLSPARALNALRLVAWQNVAVLIVVGLTVQI